MGTRFLAAESRRGWFRAIGGWRCMFSFLLGLGRKDRTPGGDNSWRCSRIESNDRGSDSKLSHKAEARCGLVAQQLGVKPIAGAESASRARVAAVEPKRAN